jgi:hypothetical protein
VGKESAHTSAAAAASLQGALGSLGLESEYKAG